MRTLGQWWRFETVVVIILIVLIIPPIGVGDEVIDGAFVSSDGAGTTESNVLTITAAADIPDFV
jgi:hypothetical protein